MAGPRVAALSSNGETASGLSAWSGLDQLGAEDGEIAVATAASGQKTSTLVLRDFALDVPAAAVIRGLVVEIVRKSGAGNIADDLVELVGVDQAASANRARPDAWNLTLQAATYGSDADTWGRSWTGADVRGRLFGVRVRAMNAGFSPEVAGIDSVRVSVVWDDCR